MVCTRVGPIEMHRSPDSNVLPISLHSILRGLSAFGSFPPCDLPGDSLIDWSNDVLVLSSASRAPRASTSQKRAITSAMPLIAEPAIGKPMPRPLRHKATIPPMMPRIRPKPLKGMLNTPIHGIKLNNKATIPNTIEPIPKLCAAPPRVLVSERGQLAAGPSSSSPSCELLKAEGRTAATGTGAGGFEAATGGGASFQSRATGGALNPAVGVTLAAAETVTVAPHFGHLVFWPASLEGALSLLPQDEQTMVIGMIAPLFCSAG